jgi:hypothetical protein
MKVQIIKKYVCSSSDLIKYFQIRYSDFQEKKRNVEVFTNRSLIYTADLVSCPTELSYS